MKLEGSLPVPSLSATLHARRGRELRIVEILGIPKRGPGRGRGSRTCTECGDAGHQRNSFLCPSKGLP